MLYGSRKFVEDSLCLGRPYHLKLFKGCLPQILLGPLSNTLTHNVLCSIINPFRAIFSLSVPLENNRKPEALDGFMGYRKEISSMKLVASRTLNFQKS